ncbi:collagen alpha-6(VI) chain [Notolabrus celidotus]|uniref:collagen alpha-6(VI) chain n=1 Tax=Notolabrus celidotus TaxID=1203425 RepID=UPI00148F9FEA|nr:collagen alpha-6(VI) chain [Notolabrus celidotus]
MEGGRGLLLGLIMATCFYGNAAQKTVCTQEAVADIVFLVDGSWSIGAENFEQIRLFLYSLVNSFDVGPDHVHIGLVQYSNDPRTEFLLNTFQTKEDILQYISELPYKGGGTNTGLGLDFLLREHFVRAAGSRAHQNVPQIAVVITDGKSQDNVEVHAQDLKKQGIVLYAVGIKEADEDQLKEIANEPHSQHVYSVSDFAALQGISQGIVQTLCTTVEEVKRQLLQLSTECSQATVADIVFLVDGSSSIGIQGFEDMRGFLRSVVSGLDIGPDKVRVGLAQYSDESYQEFLLNEHMDKTALLAAVASFNYRTGGTETGKAIDFILTRYFTEAAGSRAKQRVPQIAVVITDGDSTDDVVQPALRLRQHGVIVFGIGVGQANLFQLESIANRPPDRFLFSIDSYGALQRLTDGLLQTVCISVEDQRQALAERFADIFFLVDSGVSSTNFNQVRSVLTRLSNQLNIGADAYRLGWAQYGQDIKVESLLNAHQTREQTQSALKLFRQRKLPANEARNLGGALRYASSSIFTREAGSRADRGYRQFLVVLSGKDSDDDVYRESRLIKSSGVTVVGLSLGASVTETQLISTSPYVFRSISQTIVPELRAIFEKQEQDSVLSGDCKAAKLADIVFIVDESGSIGNQNFQLVRTFLHSIVSGLEVSPSKVRVGFVTYNDRATAHVYLNTFNVKSELLNFIKILPYHGGGTNTGAALNFTREHVFRKERGSRKDRGVQQVAVVITDGESQDDVSRAAADLRRGGITVYAIGVKDANQQELKQMASYPTNKHMFVVDSFAKLKSLEQTLQKIMCVNIIRQAVSVTTRKTSIKEGCLQTDEADIFFLIDHSGSIYPADFSDMKKFIIEFLHTFRIGPDHVRMGVAKYADSPNLEFDLQRYSDTKALENAVLAIKQVGGGTETGRALDFMGQYFNRAQVADGPKVPEYLVVITDGKSSDEVKVPAEKLRAQGVKVYAIGVKNADQEELGEISGDPKRTFFVNNFDALTPIKDDIITDICSQDACQDQPGDLIFLIDSSGSIYPEDYQKMKDFMKSVIGKSIIGQKDVHVGVMQFSSQQKLEFTLNTHFTQDDMLRAISSMLQMGGGTLTGAAISQVSQYFDTAQGGRPSLRQRLVVITDGEAQDEVKGPAAALRAKGVLVYAIGVVDANTTQLLEISGSSDRMYSERDFDALKDLESQVALELCETEGECKKTERADIIFLVDGSTSITLEKFQSMQKFMKSMVNQTSVGTNLTRFGVILYSTDAKSVFTLNQYKSKREVLNAISGLKSPYGDTYTGKALGYSLPFFGAAHGGRAALQVPQILVVITDGDATDRHSLAAPSLALRESGVRVFSIGVEGANRTQLEIMAGQDKSKVFYVDNFEALEGLYKNLTLEICEYTKPVCEKQQADLVFLLDQSGSINPSDYAIMKKFTTDLISKFKVGDDNVKVGCAQFSDVFKQEFYLNEMYTEEAVIKHIFAMEQTGGGTTIGHALNSIREHFEAARGSRRLSGISQNLVLITDGDSEDDVEDAAESLRKLGIEVFAIGIGDVHDLQLLQITGTPERLFTVQNFGSLEKIKQKVVDTICKSKQIPDRPSCSVDIAMGFDISRADKAPGDLLFSGHAKLQNFLSDIAQYVSSLHGLCCVGPAPIKTNIAYRLVGRDGRELLDTRFEPYNSDVVDKIKSQTLEPTYFNTALLRSFSQKMSTESGAGVKVVVIFSDGFDDDVMRLEQESDRLRESGVSALLVVALEGVRDPAQLQSVEFGRGFGYRLPLSIGMPSVGSSILKQIECKLITYIRDNCACSTGHLACPAYPTELVFGLDMSADVTPAAFERQRSALLSLLEDVTVAESNCPTGARVAVVGYSAYTKYLIRFHDYRLKSQLIESVKNIALERTSNSRQLGAAMRFVGQNVFKRVRSGMLMRKVAVFLTNGPTQDVGDVVTAMMEYQGLNIVPAVVSLRNAPAVRQAMEVDDTRRAIFTVLGRDMSADLNTVKDCAICYDPCKRSDQCSFIQDPAPPQEADVDLVLVMDGSREVKADEYAGAQQLLGSVVQQLAVSPKPGRPGNRARVALVQQGSTQALKEEFGLQTYQSQDLMKRHLIQNLQQQGGSSALGRTLEFALREVLLKAGQARKKRALLTVVGTQTALRDRLKLQYVSQKAKCEGVALFVVTVGERYSRTQAEELAGLPLHQHLIHVSRLNAEEQGYCQRFFRVFLSALDKGVNTYPPPSLRQTCQQLREPGEGFLDGQGAFTFVEEVGTFGEHTGRGTQQTGQLDIIETLTRGDGQSVVSAAKINARCLLRADTGLQCDESVRAWFFDTDVGACSPFWFGGCGGNANRFKTETQCFRTCGIHNPNILPKPELVSFASKDSCFLAQDQGGCQNYTMMWFFDTEQNECSRFWYGGCDGNQNRFGTQEECETLCLTKSR